MWQNSMRALQELLFALTKDHVGESWPLSVVDIVGMNMFPTNFRISTNNVFYGFPINCLACDPEVYIMVKQEFPCPQDISNE